MINSRIFGIIDRKKIW